MIKLRSDKRLLVFPVMPEEIREGRTARTSDSDAIKGSYTEPDGTQPATWSWNGILPGLARGTQSWMVARGVRDPEEIAEQLNDWLDNSKPLTLTMTETNITGERVFVSSFDHARGGGYGDITYSIELTEYSKQNVKRKRKSAGKKDVETPGGAGPDVVIYRTKPDDTLGKIAKRFLGAVKDWRDIWAIDENKRAIRKATSPNIDPDPTRKLPGGIRLKIKG